MSPLLRKFTLRNLLQPNQLKLVIGSNSMVAVHLQHNHIVNQQHIAFINQATEPTWQNIAIQLDTILSAMQMKPKCVLQVVLASDYVRYIALPAQLLAMNRDEKSAYAEAAYREVYGEVVNNWQIKCHDAAPNQSMIAAAIDKQLLAVISQAALKHKLKLTSVQPYLMMAFNTVTNEISPNAQYLVIVESGRLLLLNFQLGQYQNLRSFAFADDWQTTLKQLVSRDSLINEPASASMVSSTIKDTVAEILIYAPTHKNTTLSDIQGWKVKRIGHANNIASKFSMLEAVI